MTWTKRIDDVVSEQHLLKHPFYTAWTEGRLTQSALQGYAAQYYKHVAAFPRYLSAIHAQTPDLETRQYLLENLVDEERGAENHPELWLRFAEGIGAGRNELREATPLDETTDCDATYREIASARGPIAGLAALYAYESMVPAVSESKIAGLKAHYGIDDAETCASSTSTSRWTSGTRRSRASCSATRPRTNARLQSKRPTRRWAR